MESLSTRLLPDATFIEGVVEPAVAAVSSTIASRCSQSTVLLVDRHQRAADQWAEDLALFLQLANKKQVLIKPFPAISEEDPDSFDTSTEDDDWDRSALLTLLLERQGKGAASKKALKALPHLIIPTTPRALCQPVISPGDLDSNRILLQPGQEFPPAKLVAYLQEKLGYDREDLCEAPGQFAVRGSLVDVYPTGTTTPCRIDYFGDQIESLRPYDPTTQRSEGKIDSLAITPRTSSGNQNKAHLAAYLNCPSLVIFREPRLLEEENAEAFLVPPVGTQARTIKGLAPLAERTSAKQDTWVGIGAFDTNPSLFPPEVPRRTISTEPLSNLRPFASLDSLGNDRLILEQESRDQFLNKLVERLAQGWHLEIFFNNDGEESRFREIIEDDPGLQLIGQKAVFRRGAIHEGAVIDFGKSTSFGATKSRRVILATDSEIFGRFRTRLSSLVNRKRVHHSEIDRLLDFSDLNPGDYLVHLTHGICIFRGIETVPMDDHSEEMIALEFADSLRILTPFQESHLLSRYVGFANRSPKLGRPGAATWKKARENAEKSTLDFASKLLRLQAQRDLIPGHAFEADTPWQKEFELAFPFRETPDQLTAIREAKGDMERPRPMDRLVCGDVGFGKTEVAIRAAFKAVMGGKQVAVLVPTTVLAQQHFQTFHDRMANFPIAVEMLSRFRKPSQQKQILSMAAEGKIDILVGTHALLGEKLAFKDLGLLIIDEEHRFGVQQKETLKLLRENVDVLSMSATPIPRTLYLALAGARDLSVIETPPRNRRPVQTYIKPWSEKLIRDAIRFELGRGGQIFFLHNRVQTIHAKAEEIRQIVPEVRIGIGHGQMDEGVLEQVMLAYTRGDYDLLLCTTIIESGLDIPNSNTMIIEGADRFGLAQLYQLRGRIGRFNRQAYAYLLLPQKSSILDPAQKRLDAIRQNNQLGAGYRIALRDLELRGAGNLIGKEQSGTIAGVGFDLYCQLLRQSVARLRGEPGSTAIRAQVRLDFVQTGPLSRQVITPRTSTITGELEGATGQTIVAAIPDHYIGETSLRLDLFRKLSLAATPEVVRALAEDIRDRFGQTPPPVDALIGVAMVRVLAEQKMITLVEVQGGVVRCKQYQQGTENFLRIGGRFPRLTAKDPLSKIRQLCNLLQRA
ncbi:MAG: transcription-repair coupling factor [Puniceicoccaceae bacterium]